APRPPQFLLFNCTSSLGRGLMVDPAMTPDLNPIEQVWEQLKQRLDDRTPNGPPQNIMRLVRSGRRRGPAVTAANGGQHLFIFFINALRGSS
uniref:Tc1-like transposase DDE domain-containing protein n=1 Tax=Oryzias latipes TaxID=8090 RepID=A0A3P9HLY6_ORYLA